MGSGYISADHNHPREVLKVFPVETGCFFLVARIINIQDKYMASAREFMGKVLQKYPEKVDFIILFGSTARGEAREESDIDILVVGDVTLEELVDISFPMLLEYRKYISPKDMKKPYFEELNKEGYSFIRNVMDEGLVLYERMAEASGEI